MPPPRDPDPTDATKSPPGSAGEAQDTLVPGNPALNPEATPIPDRPGPDRPDPAEVTLVPDARSSVTDSRLRLAALLDADDPDLLEDKQPPPAAPAAEEDTLLPPGGPPAVSGPQDVTLDPSTLIHPTAAPADETRTPSSSEPSATELEGTQIPPGSGVSDAEMTRTMDRRGPAGLPGTGRADEKTVGRYAVQGLHAKGGLGEVHTARDTELDREVALKRIQARFADDPVSRRRFLAEAGITARLDHPGVVPVYGLVSDGRGRPCYAMRFIRGESLRDEIERYYQRSEDRGQKSEKSVPESNDHHVEATRSGASDDRRLAFRHLLQRFIAVCQAICYAHTRNVIHRDIKPANVMVGSFGETLVVDWGLAKVLGERSDALGDTASHPVLRAAHPGDLTEADATAMGTVVGTPAYMAPEQAAGRVDLVGPRSDVYSLGATLYCILTGKAPFAGSNPTETMRKVQRGEFVPPRTINPAVPKPLEAVCAKAMAVRPEDRYATAQELAADVERWLCDEPVTAYPEPWSARLARWARRNPARVATAVSLLLVGLAAAAVILVVVSNAQRETARARDQEKEAHEREALARDAAEKAKSDTDVANAQLKVEMGKTQTALRLAKRRFDSAKTTFKSIVEDIQSELADRAGSQELRRKLLMKAEEGLKQVLDTVGDDQDVDPVGACDLLCSVHLQMGDVYRSLGETDKAEVEYAKAAEVADGRVAAAGRPGAPPDPTALTDRADANDRLAEVALVRGHSADALARSDKALADRRAWRVAHPADPDARRDLATTLDRRAVNLLEQGQTAAAKADSDEALGLRRELFEQEKADTRAAPVGNQSVRDRAGRDFAQSLEREAVILLRTGNSEESLRQAGEAVTRRQEVADRYKEHKDRTTFRRELAAAVALRGDVHSDRGELVAALADYETARVGLAETLELDPDSVGAMAEMADVLGRIARVQLRLGRVKEGLQAAEDALAISDRLAKSDPGSALARRELAAGHGRLGDAYLANAQSDKALDEYHKGEQILTALDQTDRKNTRVTAELARVLELTGQAHLDADDPRAAVEVLNRGVKLRREQAEGDRSSVDAKRQLAAALGRRVDAHLRAGNLAAADDDAEESYRTFRDVLATDRNNRQARRDLAGGFARRSDVAERQRRPTAALILAQKSTDEYDQVLAVDTSDAQTKEDLAAGLERLADAYRFGRFREARVAAEFRAMTLRQQVLDANRTSLLARRSLMTSLRRIGNLYLEDRNLPQARKCYVQAGQLPGPDAADPIFARELGLLRHQTEVCDAIEKGTNDPKQVWPLARVRGPALAALLAPDREESFRFTETAAKLLADHVRLHDALCREGLAGLGLDERWLPATHNPEELYRVARAYAWCATKTPAGNVQDGYARTALEFLRMARECGFRDADRVNSDKVWAPLKDRPGFPPDLKP
jgi:serine/threonine protein kinase